jgi:peptidyl-prolyl cis-trans isomerase C
MLVTAQGFRHSPARFVERTKMSRYSGSLARLAAIAAAFALLLFPLSRVHAQAPAAPAAAPTVAAGDPAGDPIVARVNGQEIRLSEVAEAMQSLPQQLRTMAPNMLFPMLVDQLIDRRALALQARKVGFDKQAETQQQMAAAAERALQNAFISHQLAPSVTDAAIRARYDRDMAGKAGVEEVHARHILLAAEDAAKKVIEQLNKGADFATLARAQSTDPGAQQGGDLGFFKKDDMVGEFATAAFALKPGEFSKTPVKTQFGWHVIKLEERRTAPPPSFEDSRDDLRQRMVQEAYTQLAQAARVGLNVERFNMDGSVPRATDNAQPPAPR